MPNGQLALPLFNMEGVITKTDKLRSAIDKDRMNLFALLLSSLFSEIRDKMTLKI